MQLNGNLRRELVARHEADLRHVTFAQRDSANRATHLREAVGLPVDAGAQRQLLERGRPPGGEPAHHRARHERAHGDAVRVLDEVARPAERCVPTVAQCARRFEFEAARARAVDADRSLYAVVEHDGIAVFIECGLGDVVLPGFEQRQRGIEARIEVLALDAELHAVAVDRVQVVVVRIERDLRLEDFREARERREILADVEDQAGIGNDLLVFVVEGHVG